MPKRAAIATRRYALRMSNGRTRPVVVSLFAPEFVDPYECRFTITGLTPKPTSWRAMGEDAVQALELALLLLGRQFMESAAFKAGRLLDPFGGRPVDAISLGLPVSLQKVRSAIAIARDVPKLAFSRQLSPAQIQAVSGLPDAMKRLLAEIRDELRALHAKPGATTRRSPRRRTARPSPADTRSSRPRPRRSST